MPRAVRSGFDFLNLRFPELMEDGSFVRQFLTDVTERIRQTALGLLGGTLDMALLGASGYAKIYLTDPEAVEPAQAGGVVRHDRGGCRRRTGRDVGGPLGRQRGRLHVGHVTTLPARQEVPGQRVDE